MSLCPTNLVSYYSAAFNQIQFQQSVSISKFLRSYRTEAQHAKVINTVPSNLKTTLAGANNDLKYRKYAEHYLAGFAYHFNRRFNLRCLAATLIVDA